MLGCSSHIRTNSGLWLTRSRSRSARSARAMAARRSSSTPAKSAFRITATTSRSSNSGAARRSPCRRSRARSPSASSSARAGAMTDASTTINRRPYPREPPLSRSGTKRAHRFAGWHGSGGRRDWVDVPPRRDGRANILGATFPRSLRAGVALRGRLQERA